MSGADQVTKEERNTVRTAEVNAAQLILLLRFFPPNWPMPAISNNIDSAGGETLDIEWYASKDRIICIWMSGDRISWSGLFDDYKSHGRCEERDKMPPECYSLAQRVVEAIR